MAWSALSTGCFTGHEERIASTPLEKVELASHPPPSLSRILRGIDESSARVVGVHAPCPNRGAGVDLAATGDRRALLGRSLHETMRVASAAHADYVVVHAFYCLDAELPADDLERAAVLRRGSAAAEGLSITEYRSSDRYHAAQQLARRNLEALLPELTRAYPRQKILLENLNPRVGYGGIWLDDVAEIARALEGEVGICLDVGHLTLSATALGLDMADAVRRARDLIRILHLHQNFAGRYFVDRHWDDAAPRPDLQEVDVHLPLLARCRPVEPVSVVAVAADNSAFTDVLVGAVHYDGWNGSETSASSRVQHSTTMGSFNGHGSVTAIGENGAITGAVPLERLLELVNPAAGRVLELDSRYAPMDDILKEYGLARRGEHPILR